MKRTVLFLLLTINTFAQSNVQPVDTISPTNTVALDSTTNTNSATNFLGDFYEGTDAVETPTADLESPAIALLRIFLITAILGFLTWISIRFFFRRNAVSLSTGGKTIEILATIPAGLGAYFVVAKLGNLYYLMSLSSDGLRLLDKITDQEAIDFIELNKEDSLPQDIKFVDLLDKMPEGKSKQALEFLREKINQLKQK